VSRAVPAPPSVPDDGLAPDAGSGPGATPGSGTAPTPAPGAGQPPDVYTFGDTPTAAYRLNLLAEVYEPASRALLSRWSPDRPRHAFDLGCGPGHTTRLVHEVSGAQRTTGVDRSPAHLRMAAEHPVPGVDYLDADVTAGLPEGADLVYVRFLLTHLARPGSALRRWVSALNPGGRILVQEVSRLVSREPVLARYYELVAELQEHHGQALDIGSRLGELAADSGLEVVHAAPREVRPATAAMAALHVLNLRTWRNDDYARATFDPDELDALDEALSALAHGAPSLPVEQELGELVLQA
jgi:trans-aconitate 2-methyltransferase